MERQKWAEMGTGQDRNGDRPKPGCKQGRNGDRPRPGCKQHGSPKRCPSPSSVASNSDRPNDACPHSYHPVPILSTRLVPTPRGSPAKSHRSPTKRPRSNCLIVKVPTSDCRRCEPRCRRSLGVSGESCNKATANGGVCIFGMANNVLLGIDPARSGRSTSAPRRHRSTGSTTRPSRCATLPAACNWRGNRPR